MIGSNNLFNAIQVVLYLLLVIRANSFVPSYLQKEALLS